MKVNLYTQEHNDSTNFKKLQYISGIKMYSYDGKCYNVMQPLRDSLLKSTSFNELCNKYDVFVNILPIVKYSAEISEKGLTVEIYTEIIKRKILGLFGKKKRHKVVIGKGSITNNYDLTPDKMAELIKTNYIENKNGLPNDIYKFISKNN